MRTSRLPHVRRRRRDRESGSALLAVLCLLFTAGILTTLTIAISKENTFSIAAQVAQQRAMYTAEGVANRVQFLLAADRSLYPSEFLGETDYEAAETERFLADGLPHEIDYHGETVRFTITDTAGGADFTGSNYRNSILRLSAGREDESEWVDYLTTVSDRIADYIDTDDTATGDGGLEADDYEELGRYPLPRNDALQFREELLWIPGFRRLYPVDRHGRLSAVRLIPPSGTVSLGRLQPSLLTADASALRSLANLEDEEVDAVLEALQAWREERTPLSESLDSLIITRLNRVFSRAESGNYTVTVEAPPGAGQPFRRLVVSFAGFAVSGPSNGQFQYLEWLFF